MLIHGGRRGSWRTVDEDGLRDGKKEKQGDVRDDMYGRKEEGENPLAVSQLRPDDRRKRAGARDAS